MKVASVEKNSQGGYFERGKKFNKAKWASVIDVYQTELNSAGKCSLDRLAQLAKIGRNAAIKAVTFYELGFIPSFLKNTAKGVGSLKGLKMKHHAFIFALYLSNPALPNYGYCEEIEKNSASLYQIPLSPDGLRLSSHLKVLTTRPVGFLRPSTAS